MSDGTIVSEAQLRSALELAEVGAWVLAIGARTFTCCAACAELFGAVPTETTWTLDSLLSRVHAEDRADVERAVHRACEGAPLTVEFRVPRAQGDARWLSARGQIAVDEPGSVIGIVSDVTHHRATETRLLDALQRLEFHVENALLAVLEWDHDFRLIRWSPGAERLFGWSAAEVLGKHPRDWHFVHENDRAAVDLLMAELLGGGEARNVSRNRNYTKDGRVVYCDWRNSALLDEKGRLRSLLSLVLDVTAEVEIERARAAALASELAARREAEAASRAKDEFIALLSHELRTPLTAILGWTRILRLKGSDPAVFARAVDTIERNAKAQAQIVDDALDTSRIVTGKLRLTLGVVDPRSVLATALDGVRPSFEAKGVALAVDADGDFGSVLADAGRLQQVFWNLMSNAAKFTPAAGHVRVRLAREGSDVVFEVADDGEGIAPEFLPFVFDRFQQAESSATRAHGGLGLGLAIAKHLVELHGGTLHAASGGPGRGSTFRVVLPAPSAAESNERLRLVSGRKG